MTTPSTLQQQSIKFESKSFLGIAYDPLATQPSSLLHSLSDEATIHVMNKDSGEIVLYDFRPGLLRDSDDEYSERSLENIKSTLLKAISGLDISNKDIEQSFIGSERSIYFSALHRDTGISNGGKDSFYEKLTARLPPLAFTRQKIASNEDGFSKIQFDALNEVSGFIEMAMYRSDQESYASEALQHVDNELTKFLEKGERHVSAIEKNGLASVLLYANNYIDNEDANKKIDDFLLDNLYSFLGRDSYIDSLSDFCDSSDFEKDNQHHVGRILALSEITLKSERARSAFCESIQEACNKEDGKPHLLLLSSRNNKKSGALPAIRFLSSATRLAEDEQINKIQFYQQANWAIQIRSMLDTHLDPRNLEEHLIASSHTGVSFRNSLKDYYQSNKPDLSPQIGKKHAQIVINNLMTNRHFDKYTTRNNTKGFYKTLNDENIELEVKNNVTWITLYDKNGEQISSSSRGLDLSHGFTTELLPYINVSNMVNTHDINSLKLLYNNNPGLRQEHRKSITSFLNHEKDEQGRKTSLTSAMAWVNNIVKSHDEYKYEVYRRNYLFDSRRMHQELLYATALAKLSQGRDIKCDADSIPDTNNIHSQIEKLTIGQHNLNRTDFQTIYDLEAGHPNKRHYDKKYVDWANNVHEASIALKREFPAVSTQNWQPCTSRVHIGSIGDNNYFAQPLHSYHHITEEGNEMNHCIGTYAQDAANGKYYAWSIQKESDGLSERVSTLGMLNHDYEGLIFDQHYGVKNSRPDDGVQQLVEQFSSSVIASSNKELENDNINFNFTKDNNESISSIEKAGLIIGYNTTPEFAERATSLIDKYMGNNYVDSVIHKTIEASQILKRIMEDSSIPASYNSLEPMD